MYSQTILIKNVNPKREHVRIKPVQVGRNGPSGVLVPQIAGRQEKTHRHNKDTVVGTQKQVLELIAALEKEIMITINHSHVIVILKIYVKEFVNGIFGIIGLNAILTAMRV